MSKGRHNTGAVITRDLAVKAVADAKQVLSYLRAQCVRSRHNGGPCKVSTRRLFVFHPPISRGEGSQGAEGGQRDAAPRHASMITMIARTWWASRQRTPRWACSNASRTKSVARDDETRQPIHPPSKDIDHDADIDQNTGDVATHVMPTPWCFGRIAMTFPSTRSSSRLVSVQPSVVVGMQVLGRNRTMNALGVAYRRSPAASVHRKGKIL